MFRAIYVITAAAFFAAAPFSHAAGKQYDAECTRAMIPQTAASRIELGPLFAAKAREVVETSNGLSAPMGQLEVVVARIGADGRPVLACVDSEEAARRFLEAPVEKLPAARRDQ